MNNGNDDVYLYFADTSGTSHAGLFKASRFLGIRPGNSGATTTEIKFLAQTHDNNAVDTVTLTHAASTATNGIHTAIVRAVTDALCASSTGNRKMITVVDDQLGILMRNCPPCTTAITFDA